MSNAIVANTTAELDGATILTAEAAGDFHKDVVTLTAAQVKALNTTPIELVAAPGANSAILVNRILFYSVFITPAYTGSNNLEFRYTDASGAKVTADIAAATLNFASGTKYSFVNGIDTELVPVANSPIVVRVPTANPGAGNSIVKFIVWYEIVAAP